MQSASTQTQPATTATAATAAAPPGESRARLASTGRSTMVFDGTGACCSGATADAAAACCSGSKAAQRSGALRTRSISDVSSLRSNVYTCPCPCGQNCCCLICKCSWEAQLKLLKAIRKQRTAAAAAAVAAAAAAAQGAATVAEGPEDKEEPQEETDVFAGKTLLLVKTGRPSRTRVLASMAATGIRLVALNEEGPNWADEYVDGEWGRRFSIFSIFFLTCLFSLSRLDH